MVERSERSPWYDGPDAAGAPARDRPVAGDRRLEKLRMPIQWVARNEDRGRRGYTGQIAGGVLREGDEVVVQPAGSKTTDRLARHARSRRGRGHPRPVGHRGAGGRPGREPRRRARLARATSRRPPASWTPRVCWMAEEPLKAGRRYALKHTSRTVRATVQAVHERTDPETLEPEADPAGAGAQRHRPGDPEDLHAGPGRPVRREPRDRRVHPHRRAHQRHRRGRAGRPRRARSSRRPRRAAT